MAKVKLTAELIEAFAGMYLSPRYDNPAPTPDFHRQAWALYCSDHPQCMVIAPREHAKTTGLTFDYILAEVCFRTSDYVVIIGSTEDLAAEMLSNIAEELRENDDLRRDFDISHFEQDVKTDIIIRCLDGHRFRIVARGAEQRIRGRMWNGKRPNLLVGDDMEDDEQVENRDRRLKFRRWFFRAAKQALGRYGKTRVHGTVLNEDSLLARLRKNKAWKHLFFKAHEAFDDFTNILWPEQWPEARLRMRQMEFVQDGDSAGYSQEFLNDPQDNAEAYLRKSDFLPMSQADYEAQKQFGQGLKVCAAADFAVSKLDAANRTSLTVGGMSVENLLYYIDQHVGRWDSVEIIDMLFAVHKRWTPEVFFVEDGVIWKALWPTIRQEMTRTGIYINFEPVPSVKDKATRGRSFQRRMRAGACRYHKEAEWYPGFENELLKFTGYSEATLDDQFDSAALLSRGFDDLPLLEDEDFIEEEEMEMRRTDPRVEQGRSSVTGY